MSGHPTGCHLVHAAAIVILSFTATLICAVS